MTRMLAPKLPKLYLAPSRGRGVGVFAFSKIKRGELINDWSTADWRFVPNRKAKGPLKALCNHFGVQDERGYHIPKDWHHMTIGWYVNHSKNPNIAYGDSEKSYALRDIERGEELFVDYAIIEFSTNMRLDFVKALRLKRRAK